MSVFRVWLVFFAYSVAAAAFVQLLLLPVLLPEFHWRDGLLIVGDWHYFQPFAEKAVKEIHLHGWSQWSLRPSGQAPAGIAAAIYAVLVPKPYVLIPLFAALHATGAVMVMRLVELFGIRRRLAVFAALPFLLGPTAILWFTQIHKDTLYAPGLVFCLYGWVYLLQMKTVGGGDTLLRKLVVFFLSVSTGIFLIWVVRPQYIEVVTVFALMMVILGFCVMAIRTGSGLMPWRNAVVVVIALAVVPAVLLIMKMPKVSVGLSYFEKTAERVKTVEIPKHGKAVEMPEDGRFVEVPKGIKAVGVTKDGAFIMLTDEGKFIKVPEEVKPGKVPEKVKPGKVPEEVKPGKVPEEVKFVGIPKGVKAMGVNRSGKFVVMTENGKVVDFLKTGKPAAVPETGKPAAVPETGKPAGVAEGLWQPSQILPGYVDGILKRVYAYREYFYRATSNKMPGSTFDQGRFLNSAENMVRYLPRALQIGIFSPFPEMWFQPGTAPVYKVMRRVNGLEMLCLYVAMLGLVPAIYYWRRRIEIWVILGFFIYFTLVPIYVLPNIGTMVRYRYAPIMAIAGLGVAAIGMWLQGRKR